ncbi:MAG: porin family protein [Chitinophagaceae bacterium]|nr:porin family protein [Chitinophagaceae bacterium]
MKKILVSAMALVLITGSASTVMAQQGFSVGIKATPQFSFLQNSDDNDNNAIKKKATFNTNFGVGAGYNFTDNTGVGLDVLYSLQGEKSEVLGLEVNQKLEYVKVPVYFSYNSDASNAVSFFGKVGPQVSFLTNAKISGGGSDKFIDNKDKFEKATLGAMANAGVQFKLSPNIFLQTGLQFDYDFTNAEDKDYAGHISGRSNTYNMTAGVQVGLKYRF